MLQVRARVHRACRQGPLERFPLGRSNAVAAMPGVVRAFVWGEEAERGRDQTADVLKAPRTRGAQERFQFGEGEFDRIEVGAVRRKETKVRARLLDRRPDFRAACGPRDCRAPGRRPVAASARALVRCRPGNSDYRSAHRIRLARQDPRGAARRSRCASASDCRACDRGSAYTINVQRN